jgi:hypothetical protein
MNPIPCSVCKEEGHSAGKCPTLVDPLKPGFYTGGGGAGRYSEEEDESICDDGYYSCGVYDFYEMRKRYFYASLWRIFC